MLLLYAYFAFISCFLLENNAKVFYFFSHGTRCAGAAAGKANNELCGVGVAYGAFIAG